MGGAFLVFYMEETISMPFMLLPALNGAVWIWAIVDVSIKKDVWYRSYLKRRPIRASNGTSVITREPIFCPRCGTTALEGKNYCWNCGRPTIDSDDYCRRCGVSLMDIQSAKFCRSCGRSLTDK